MNIKPIFRSGLAATKALMARIESHNLTLIAAGIAFYAFISIFPAIAVCVSLYGLVSEPSAVQDHIDIVGSVLPPEVLNLVRARLADIANDEESSLTWGLVIGIVLSLWSANRAMKAVAQGLNIAFEKEEDRGFIEFNLVTLGLTFVSSLIFIVVVAVAVALPPIVNYVLSNESAKILTTISSWTIILFMLFALFLLLYRKAPARRDLPKFSRSIPGSVFSTVFVLMGSILFSVYVAHFGSYDEEYGAISAVVVTLLWLYLCSFVFLLGAEFNGENRLFSGLFLQKGISNVSH